MWFTRVSLKQPGPRDHGHAGLRRARPVLATSACRSTSSRTSTSRWWWCRRTIPGASPEIVESEVTKKIEEGGQHDRRHQRPHLAQLRRQRRSSSSSSSSTSTAARRPTTCARRSPRSGRCSATRSRSRASRASIRPSRADLVDSPCCPTPTAGRASSRSELTNWADQVLKKRLENVRGVGSVTLVGGIKREINIYLQPGGDGGAGHRRRPGGRRRAQREPGPAGRRASARCDAGARGADQRAHAAARGLRRHHRRPQGAGGAPVRCCGQVADVVDGPQELDSLALYNGQRTLLLSVQKSQDENTIEVVDGLQQGARRDQARSCRPACGWSRSRTARARSACRWRTCGAR